MHTSLVTRILFSPDGKQPVHRVARTRPSASGTPRRGRCCPCAAATQQHGSGGQILNAALSKDGKLLAVLALARKETSEEDWPAGISLIELSSGRILHAWPGAGDRRWAPPGVFSGRQIPGVGQSGT